MLRSLADSPEGSGTIENCGTKEQKRLELLSLPPGVHYEMTMPIRQKPVFGERTQGQSLRVQTVCNFVSDVKLRLSKKFQRVNKYWC